MSEESNLPPIHVRAGMFSRVIQCNRIRENHRTIPFFLRFIRTLLLHSKTEMKIKENGRKDGMRGQAPCTFRTGRSVRLWHLSLHQSNLLSFVVRGCVIHVPIISFSSGWSHRSSPSRKYIYIKKGQKTLLTYPFMLFLRFIQINFCDRTKDARAHAPAGFIVCSPSLFRCFSFHSQNIHYATEWPIPKWFAHLSFLLSFLFG